VTTTQDEARIDREALYRFIDEALARIINTPPPTGMGTLTDGLSAAEERALWMAAGIASQIGIALMENPLPFVAPLPIEGDGE